MEGEVPKKKKTKRTCLRCDREFLSDGIYNRICPNCRESNSNIAINEPPEPLPDYVLNSTTKKYPYD
ncbi:hypothetical protein ACFL2U_03435 [Patescibacteria group bacterium]